MALDKMLNRNSLLTRWDGGTSKVAGTFDSHDFGMKWSYAEMAVAVESLGLEWALDDMKECIEKLVEMSGHFPSAGRPEPAGDSLIEPLPTDSVPPPAPVTTVINGDGRMLDLDDASVDAVVFDPPYHNNVNYAELSDFFYVWLKRTAGYVLDDGLFAEHLTDKVNEAIASPARFKQHADDKNVGRTES